MAVVAMLVQRCASVHAWDSLLRLLLTSASFSGFVGLEGFRYAEVAQGSSTVVDDVVERLLPHCISMATSSENW